MIAVVDYGAGNLFSVQNACRFLGMETYIAHTPEELKRSSGIILPGVGAFPDAMQQLEQGGFADEIIMQARSKPILGICLGMQMLFQYSTEFKKTKGLCLMEGYVDQLDAGALKLPHIGWNSLRLHQKSPLSSSIEPGDYVYFVHSFYAICKEIDVIASTRYNKEIPALVGNRNIFGVQFHPEKSGDVGLAILENFGRLVQQ